MHENEWHRACLLFAPIWEPIGQYLGVSFLLSTIFNIMSLVQHQQTKQALYHQNLLEKNHILTYKILFISFFQDSLLLLNITAIETLPSA